MNETVNLVDSGENAFHWRRVYRKWAVFLLVTRCLWLMCWETPILNMYDLPEAYCSQHYSRRDQRKFHGTFGYLGFLLSRGKGQRSSLSVIRHTSPREVCRITELGIHSLPMKWKGGQSIYQRISGIDKIGYWNVANWFWFMPLWN